MAYTLLAEKQQIFDQYWVFHIGSNSRRVVRSFSLTCFCGISKNGGKGLPLHFFIYSVFCKLRLVFFPFGLMFDLQSIADQTY